MKLGGFVYILANKPMGTIYIGSTSNIAQRMYQHRNKFFESFTKKYDVKLLVYYEFHDSLEKMVKRERQMKEWKRSWKLARIIEFNPNWLDLFDELSGEIIDLLEKYKQNNTA
ncbi:MAG: GIY-YIG nuclease family protein [Rickettsiales bacterium]|jgi:putative endonuclease|nr:GIY-YIG nuclease family protein [Rickettsiales bacterium]